MASGYYKVKETAGKVVDDAEHPFDRDIARIDHLEREAEDGTLFKEHPDIVKQQGLEGKDPGKVKEGGTVSDVPDDTYY